jgi:hypothetical protein
VLERRASVVGSSTSGSIAASWSAVPDASTARGPHDLARNEVATEFPVVASNFGNSASRSTSWPSAGHAR